MDIAGAFDNVSFRAVLTSLEQLGIDAFIRGCIKFMLANRSITIMTSNEQVSVVATRGTPQGGVLSPTLWTLVMDELLKQLHAERIRAIGYADNLTITCRGKFISTLSDITQRGVRIVEK